MSEAQQQLQQLLEHRQRLEDQRQQALAQAQVRLAQAEGQVHLAELARQALQAGLAQAFQQARLHITTIQSGQLRLRQAEAEVTRAQAERAAVHAQCEAARQAAVVASQDRLALERLLEQQQAAAQLVAARAEAERLGELGLARWAASRHATTDRPAEHGGKR